MIYTRQPHDGTQIVRDFARLEKELQEVKATQITGTENLVIVPGFQLLSNSPVAADATAIFEATYTFSHPPSEAMVWLTFLSLISEGAVGSSFRQATYDDPATLDNGQFHRTYYAYSPTAATSIDLYCLTKSAARGVLSLVRVQ